jgi:hypothetical protein
MLVISEIKLTNSSAEFGLFYFGVEKKKKKNRNNLINNICK